MLISGSCFSQDTLLIEDGSIRFSMSSCSIDYRCYENIDDIVATHCSDSITVISIELKENVFEKATNVYTDCRVKRLGDYLRGKHEIHVPIVLATPVLMTREEMQIAIREKNFRTIIIVLGKPEKAEM